MRIRMEHADIKHLVYVIVDDIAAYILHVVTFLDQAVLMGDRITVHKGHGEDHAYGAHKVHQSN